MLCSWFVRNTLNNALQLVCQRLGGNNQTSDHLFVNVFFFLHLLYFIRYTMFLVLQLVVTLAQNFSPDAVLPVLYANTFYSEAFCIGYFLHIVAVVASSSPLTRYLLGPLGC